MSQSCCIGCVIISEAPEGIARKQQLLLSLMLLLFLMLNSAQEERENDVQYLLFKKTRKYVKEFKKILGGKCFKKSERS